MPRPLVIASPGRFEPRRVATNVSLVDLMRRSSSYRPEISDRLALGVDGCSLAPHLRGASRYDEAIGGDLAEGTMATIMMIRRGWFRFIHSPADTDQLYDLSHDPGEHDNLADNAPRAGLVADFAPSREALGPERTRRPRTPKPAPTPARRRRAQQGQDPGLGFPASREASRQYVRNSIDLDDLEAVARFPRSAPGPEISEQE